MDSIYRIDKTSGIITPAIVLFREIVEENRFPLWHSWPLFLILMGLVATEWIIRKKVGLA